MLTNYDPYVFGERNTRSTAVFIIKYFKTFGFNVSNETFAENSWYFRNALVRAIKIRTVEMQEKGLIAREPGKRKGKWKVMVEV